MKDKINHLIVGAVLGIATYFSGHWLLGFVLATIVFVLKEVYDCIKPLPTGFDKADLQADFLGWIAGAILSFFIHGIIQILLI